MKTNTKRGRPFGSTTLENMKLADLIEKFGPDTVLPVGRLWLKEQEAKKLEQTPVQVHQKIQVISAKDHKVLGVIDAEDKIEFALID